MMTDEDKLKMLEAELDMRHADEKREAQLKQLLTVAASRIERYGITLRDDLDDTQLQVSMAAWIYRRRNQITGPALPAYLRMDLHDRLIQEKGGESDG